MTDLKGQRILLLGDSHTYGIYGSTLERLLKTAGADVTRIGWVGATASNYLKGNYRKIGLGGQGDYEKAKADPWDIAVVSLGTNDAAALRPGQSADEAASLIKKLADELNARVIWYVGPPAFDEFAAKTYNPAFAKESLIPKAERLWASAKALFQNTIDPRAATQPFVQKKDIHFTSKGGNAWADAVYGTVAGTGDAIATTKNPPLNAGGTGVVFAALALVGAFIWWRRSKRGA
jgi:hypothetical protein